jgi:hypothetical protein
MMMYETMRADDDVQTLNCDKLADQKKIIDLQNQNHGS